MWVYYLYMGLLIATLVLWGIVALRDDAHENGNSAAGQAETERGKET
jgi:hypothetical protein